MNPRFLPLLCAGALLAPAIASADYHTSFQVPPYVLNSTIVGPDKTVGIDGWRDSVGTSSALQNAIVVAAPWSPTTPVLKLKKTANNEDPVRVMNSSFEPMTGVVQIKLGLALDIPIATNKTGGTRFNFRDTSQTATPISFGMDYGATGGLYYQGSGTAVVLLSKSELKLNSVYEFTLTIDLNEHKFDVSITGLRADNTAFSSSAEDVAFSTGFSGISLIYLENFVSGSGAAQFGSYISHIDVDAIPEPGSTALMLGGAGIALGLRLRKRSASNRK